VSKEADEKKSDEVIICHPLLLIAVHCMVLVKVRGSINRKTIKNNTQN